MDKETAKPWEKPWTTDEIREHSANWNLAGDSGLLNHLQEFSQNLLAQTHATEVALDKLVEDLKTTSTSVQNATNKFLFLANTQFVENRVYDDDEKETPPEEKKSDMKPPKTKEEQEAEVFQNVKQALDMGLAILDTHFEAVEVPASDSEEEESSASVGRLVLKPKNPYLSRPLPYLIGSREFMDDDRVGLGDISSDTEESPDQNVVQSSESDDEMEHDEFVVTPKRPMILSSSDSENSEPESDQSETVVKQKKLRTSSAVRVLGEEEEVGGDMFGQESSPEADEVAGVKVNLKSNFSDELSSKLGSTKPQKLPEGRREKDNMFVPSSETEDDTGLFGKTSNSFTEKQGLFDDLDDWKNTSNSLWDDNISARKPSIDSSPKKLDKTDQLSSDFYDNKVEDDMFSTAKPRGNVTADKTKVTKILTSTPDTVSKTEEDVLFTQKDEAEDLFVKKPKDTIAASSNSSLFSKDVEDDDLFAVPSSSMGSHLAPPQNHGKKKLPGAIPVFSDVSFFDNLSPVLQQDFAVANETQRNSLSIGFQSDSGTDSAVRNVSEKEGENSSQHCENATKEKSSSINIDQLFQSALTSTKIQDTVLNKSSLFKEENDSDSLFDKPNHSNLGACALNRGFSGSMLAASSGIKTKTKKSVSLFDDSDSGDDELLFSSTSSTSSRSRRSQGSGDILAGAAERRTLPVKRPFEDSILFGVVSKEEPEIDIFSSHSESNAKGSSLTKDQVFDRNDVIGDNSVGAKKLTSSIFDDIDDVDDIFAVPKIIEEKALSHKDSDLSSNSGKLSFFSDDIGGKSDIFSNKFQERKETERLNSVVEETSKGGVSADSVIADISTSLISDGIEDISFSAKVSAQEISVDRERKEQVSKSMKPSVSKKPKVPMKPTPSVALQKSSQLSNVTKMERKEENDCSSVANETGSQDSGTVISVSADNCGSKYGNSLEVGKVGNQMSSGSSLKPEPPRTLNIRKTTDIVFESPSNEDDLFESNCTEKSLMQKENIFQKQSNNSTLSPNNFSKLLGDFNSTSPVTTSASNISKEDGSKNSSVSRNTDLGTVISGMSSAVSGDTRHTLSPSKLRIDPRALLPGAKPPSMTVTENRAVDFDKPAEVSSMLHSAGKERVKIQVKRRPQTRRARQEALRASSIEYDTIDAALISQISNSKNDIAHSVFLSVPSTSPVNITTPKVLEPGYEEKSPVVERSTNDGNEKSPKNNSEGQSSISESEHLALKTDAYKLILSDGLSGNSNPLSPLTDEEDLFAVPHELPFDETNKEASNDRNIFGGAPVISPLDLRTEVNDFNSHSILKTHREQDDILSESKDSNSHIALGGTLKSNDMFQDDVLASNISIDLTASDEIRSETVTSVSNTEDVFAKHSDSKWFDSGHLDSPPQERGLFDVRINLDDDGVGDDDLFSTVKKYGKRNEKESFPGDSKISLFSPDTPSNSHKAEVLREKSSEEFNSSISSQSKVPIQKDSEGESDILSVSPKNVAGGQGDTDDNSLLCSRKMSDALQRKETDNLFANNISAKNASSIKITDKVKTIAQQEKVKSHVDSLFGDDSTESDYLFGSLTVPKKPVAGSSSNSTHGSKLRETRESLFDDGDDDDIFSIGLNKNKGPKPETLFSKDENPIQDADDSDDLFSKKSTNSRSQSAKPSLAQKVQSFEDPLMVFNK